MLPEVIAILVCSPHTAKQKHFKLYKNYKKIKINQKHQIKIMLKFQHNKTMINIHYEILLHGSDFAVTIEVRLFQRPVFVTLRDVYAAYVSITKKPTQTRISYN